jgi:hypothetical protein
MEGNDDAIPVSLDLNIIKTASQQAAAGGRKIRGGNLDIKASTSSVSFVVIDRRVGYDVYR